MTETEPELYVPRPGSHLWKVLSYLIEHTETELQRKDVVEKFGVAYNSVDMVMQLATARGALNKKRNSANQVVWTLGLVKRFRLDPMPEEVHIPGEQPDAVLQKGAPPGKWSASQQPVIAPTAPVVDRPVQPVVKPKAIIVAAPTPTAKPAAPVVRELEVKVEPELQIPKFLQKKAPIPIITSLPPASDPRETEGSLPVTVAMPLHLTPELIEAVKTDPATSFDNKTDGHHAIGWLMDAWAVMVKRQSQGVSP